MLLPVTPRIALATALPATLDNMNIKSKLPTQGVLIDVLINTVCTAGVLGALQFTDVGVYVVILPLVAWVTLVVQTGKAEAHRKLMAELRANRERGNRSSVDETT
jgi:hypothetical protein